MSAAPARVPKAAPALALALLVALALVPIAALAAPPRADLVDIEDEVMCVTCKVPLNIAEGAQPDSQRARIRELIAEGKTKQEIKQVLVNEYGADVLALPQTGGVGLTAYLVPLALLAAVLAALALLVPRWRRRPASGIGRAGSGAPGTAGVADGDGAARDLSDEDARRLDEDLARYDA
jgi:cytochrome c-type biogenesis protein CcmH/NrfF